MKKIYAFFLGMREFRASITTNCGDQDYAYERGRDLAHRLTFRRYED